MSEKEIPTYKKFMKELIQDGYDTIAKLVGIEMKYNNKKLDENIYE